jgi:DNA-binding transcriptional LysR family regulator
VALTEAGDVLLRHANAILGLVERAHLDFRAFELRRATENAASSPLQRRVA